MKLMKLMTVTALTTATVFGSFVESAEARGGRWSASNTQEVDTVLEFSLFTQTPGGEDILDSEPNNPNLGLFKGAIEDFYFDSISESSEEFPNSGSEYIYAFEGSFLDGSFPVLDLKVERETNFREESIIFYSFIDPDTEKEVFPDNIQLYINPNTGKNVFPEQELDTGFSFSFPAEDLSKIVDDPVNSVEDILTFFAWFVRADDEIADICPPGFAIECLNNRNSFFEIDSIASVSEPSSVNMLLTFGIFTLGFALRNKLQIK